MTVSAAVAGSDAAAPADLTLVIADDDDLPELSVAAAGTQEGGAVSFTITLGAVSAKTVTVTYATALEAGDLASAEDFRAAGDTRIFPPGVT